jgi:hypothetical protein
MARPLAVTSAAAPLTGLSVRVTGTNLSSVVGSDGRFQIVDVPGGSVTLQFTGDGVNVTTTLTNVSTNQFIEIQVQISGSSAVVVADSRAGKVTMCHVEGNGSYHAISVSESAENDHRAHGDGKIGEPVPGRPSLRFDDGCQAVGPSIDIEVLTNGNDADSPTGPSILVGNAVAWSYVVKNTGTVPLTNVAVTDNRVAVDCHGVTALVVGASMQCDASGSASLGQYSNLGSVSASWTMGSSSGTVTDSDASHYLGIAALPSEGGGAKVTLCHRTGAGKYNLLAVDDDAVPAHRAHGDAKVGEAVPEMAGKVFGPSCAVQ